MDIPGAADTPATVECPRCGWSATPRAVWLWIEHCPRCIAQAHRAIKVIAQHEIRVRRTGAQAERRGDRAGVDGTRA